MVLYAKLRTFSDSSANWGAAMVLYKCIKICIELQHITTRQKIYITTHHITSHCLSIKNAQMYLFTGVYDMLSSCVQIPHGPNSSNQTRQTGPTQDANQTTCWLTAWRSVHENDINTPYIQIYSCTRYAWTNIYNLYLQNIHRHTYARGILYRIYRCKYTLYILYIYAFNAVLHAYKYIYICDVTFMTVVERSDLKKRSLTSGFIISLSKSIISASVFLIWSTGVAFGYHGCVQ